MPIVAKRSPISATAELLLILDASSLNLLTSLFALRSPTHHSGCFSVTCLRSSEPFYKHVKDIYCHRQSLFFHFHCWYEIILPCRRLIIAYVVILGLKMYSLKMQDLKITDQITFGRYVTTFLIQCLHNLVSNMLYDFSQLQLVSRFLVTH